MVMADATTPGVEASEAPGGDLGALLPHVRLFLRLRATPLSMYYEMGKRGVAMTCPVYVSEDLETCSGG